MRIGYSSLVAPQWDLQTLITKAAEYGYEGLELRGIKGQLDLPTIPELAGKPEFVREVLQEKGIELICLGSSVTFDSKNKKKLAEQKGILKDYIELAASVGCPNVRIYAGEIQPGFGPIPLDHQRALQARVAEALVEMAPIAARHGVNILIENGGDLSDSGAMWFLVDATGYPSVKCCWNQSLGVPVGEYPTTSIPRLGRKIGMVHICDANYADNGLLQNYCLPGEGETQVDRQVDLLKGLAYSGYLTFEWPKLWDASLPEPDVVLPQIAAYLKEQIAAKQNILSAYKGDKNPTKFESMEATS
ncbi:MAG: sugar phosphate isomerase/epimerase family protein [Phycisphaerae bacterium]